MGVPPVLIQILEWDFPVHKNQPAIGYPHDELETSIWHTWILHGNVPQLPRGITRWTFDHRHVHSTSSSLRDSWDDPSLEADESHRKNKYHSSNV